MDLRNELRGSRQNHHDWYKYMTQGANTIHDINPDFIVIISGLAFDNDLSFLKKKPLDLNFPHKIVYESHIYSVSGDTHRWRVQPVNWICNATIQLLHQQSSFLLSGKNPAPLLVSEFGYDMTGGSFADNMYLPCIVSYFASVDLDWSLWAFQGSYYYRQGKVGLGESYAVMDDDWKSYRDPNFTQKFELLQRMVQGIIPTQRYICSIYIWHVFLIPMLLVWSISTNFICWKPDWSIFYGLTLVSLISDDHYCRCERLLVVEQEGTVGLLGGAEQALPRPLQLMDGLLANWIFV